MEFATNKLYVRRQMQRGEFCKTKTASSVRAVPMPAELVHELKKWKLACPKGERDLVFPNRSGSALLEPALYAQGLGPALRRAGLRSVRLHDLRHGYGSMLISGGVSIKAVSLLMGHSNAALTLKVYTHALPGDTDGAARVLSGKVFGPSSKGDGHFLGTNLPESRADGASSGIFL